MPEQEFVQIAITGFQSALQISTKGTDLMSPKEVPFNFLLFLILSTPPQTSQAFLVTFLLQALVHITSKNQSVSTYKDLTLHPNLFLYFIVKK